MCPDRHAAHVAGDDAGTIHGARRARCGHELDTDEREPGGCAGRKRGSIIRDPEADVTRDAERDLVRVRDDGHGEVGIAIVVCNGDGDLSGSCRRVRAIGARQGVQDRVRMESFDGTSVACVHDEGARECPRVDVEVHRSRQCELSTRSGRCHEYVGCRTRASEAELVLSNCSAFTRHARNGA